jgi:hypothetical protein
MNVATVTRDGTVRIYGWPREGVRPFRDIRHFSNYGQALHWAAEYEDRERAAMLKRSK